MYIKSRGWYNWWRAATAATRKDPPNFNFIKENYRSLLNNFPSFYYALLEQESTRELIIVVDFFFFFKDSFLEDRFLCLNDNEY